MAEDESNKGTGDPLRDAIAGQVKAENDALEELRTAALARERDLLKAKVQSHNAWTTSPSLEEFNDDWWTPLDALEVSDVRMADDEDKWAIAEKLKAGAIRAVARTGQMNPNILGTDHLVIIFPGSWQRMDADAEHYFWKTGHLVVPTGRADPYGQPLGDKERYFDIKFDPASFTGRPLPTPPQEKPDPVVMARAAVESALENVSRNPFGRPRKDFWENLLVEMFDQLWHGTLVPRVQADIENAMADWLSANGHTASERSIRQRAVNLWKVWNKEGNN